VSAEIVDFKTDSVSSLRSDRAAAHHSTQLTAYRSALASTLGLQLGSVTAGWSSRDSALVARLTPHDTETPAAARANAQDS